MIAWTAHLAIYPCATVYGWALADSVEAFEEYLTECCEHWEALRDAQLAAVEHSTV